MNKLLVVLAMALSMAWAQDIAVSYLSQEFVYLNAGSQAGLAQGDILGIVQNQSIELEVLYTSQYSSACKMLTAGQPPKTGDSVYIKKKLHPIEEVSPPVADRPISRSTRSDMKISGYYTAYTDTLMNGQGLKLAVRTVAGIRDLDITFKGSLRNYSNGSVSNNQKVDLADVVYIPTEGYKVKLGRIIPNDVSYVGVIDGGQAMYTPAPGWFVGAIAGASPISYYDYVEKTQKISMYSKWEQISSEDYSLSLLGILHESGPSKNNINTLFYNTSFPKFMNWDLNCNTLYGNISDNGATMLKQFNVDGTIKLSKTLQSGFATWYDASGTPYYGLRVFGQIKEAQSRMGFSSQIRLSETQKSAALAITYQGKDVFIAPSIFNARGDWSWSSDYYSLSGSGGVAYHCFSIHDLTLRGLWYLYRHDLSATSVSYISLQITDEIELLSNWNLSFTAEQFFGSDTPANSIYLNSTLFF